MRLLTGLCTHSPCNRHVTADGIVHITPLWYFQIAHYRKTLKGFEFFLPSGKFKLITLWPFLCALVLLQGKAGFCSCKWDRPSLWLTRCGEGRRRGMCRWLLLTRATMIQQWWMCPCTGPTKRSSMNNSLSDIPPTLPLAIHSSYRLGVFCELSGSTWKIVKRKKWNIWETETWLEVFWQIWRKRISLSNNCKKSPAFSGKGTLGIFRRIALVVKELFICHSNAPQTIEFVASTFALFLFENSYCKLILPS